MEVTGEETENAEAGGSMAYSGDKVLERYDSDVEDLILSDNEDEEKNEATESLFVR